MPATVISRAPCGPVQGYDDAQLYAGTSFRSTGTRGLLRRCCDTRLLVLTAKSEPTCLRWLEGGRRTARASIACAAMAGLRLVFPWACLSRAKWRGDGCAHSSRDKKVPTPRHPPQRSVPKTGAAAIAFGLQGAIEAAMVAGSISKGEVTWQASAPSRSPATSSRARS